MVLGVLVSVPFAALLVVLGSVSADAGTAGAAAGPATGIVVVQAGESLWQIAQQIAPQADPRATITVIRELNGLGESAVVPGQAIIVPTSG
jgi:LysM repeat protein